MLKPSSFPARVLAVLLALGAAFLCYRAGVLIGSGHAARYVGWLWALTWVELVLAATIAGAALGWVFTGAASWCRWTLRLTAAIILLHAVRVAVFALARTGPWGDFDLRVEHRPLDPAAWTWFDVWFASGMAALCVLVLVGVLIWRWIRPIHK